MKTYIVHYTKLKDRRHYMDLQLDKLGITAEYIEDYDQEDLTPEIINSVYEKSPENYEGKIKGLWNEEEFKYRELVLPEISCTIKHFEAVKRVAEDEGEYGFILEDDVVFSKYFNEKFEENLRATPENWDAIFVGSGCGFDFQKFKLSDSERVSPNCFLVGHPATNCAEAYLIKKKTAKAIIDSVYPFNLISDWELAYQFYKLDHKVYWWCPSLIEQGSKNGMYESTLDVGQR
jgi:GR25 family glycosyltransferase involved in LPS biosynthesis|tara:strand:- start:941 stop:1639 length:699 start_codon:yes stop_codon:yes gene_type:complete